MLTVRGSDAFSNAFLLVGANQLNVIEFLSFRSTAAI